MDDGPRFIDLTLGLDRFWLITRINYTFAGMEEMARRQTCSGFVSK